MKTDMQETIRGSGPKIRPFLLWDVNINQFDYISNKQLVIERTCSLGNLNDFKELVRFYSLDTIKDELLSSVSLDKKTLSFFSLFFNISPEKFKCYSKRQ